MSAPLYQTKAELFHALAHPVRIRVLEILSERDAAVHELRARIDIEAPRLSQQLAVLRGAGLVLQRREAGSVIYALAVPEVRALLAAGRRLIMARAAHTDELVDELSPEESP